ncbi:methyltransferase domain-containing protein [Bhargavaea ullalensis]|uniref:Ubiquinone/menaquinone biosynthesis C-methylase UbiE n=1 Tax=Bhargavaea ullalensis TaxID=1265685 RepID=A0ABV2GDM0_9BACL
MSVFSRTYDQLMSPLEAVSFRKVRREIAQDATGRVLEIGAGTGLNFPFYAKAKSVDAVEPDPEMGRQSFARIREASVPIRLFAAGAEALPFPDGRFDTVIATLVFCTIPEPERALREIRRVAKPGARFVLFEHVRMPSRPLAALQKKLTPAWSKIADGCRLDRDTAQLVREAGISVRRLDSFAGGLFIRMECIIP